MVLAGRALVAPSPATIPLNPARGTGMDSVGIRDQYGNAIVTRCWRTFSYIEVRSKKGRSIMSTIVMETPGKAALVVTLSHRQVGVAVEVSGPADEAVAKFDELVERYAGVPGYKGERPALPVESAAEKEAREDKARKMQRGFAIRAAIAAKKAL